MLQMELSQRLVKKLGWLMNYAFKQDQQCCVK